VYIALLIERKLLPPPPPPPPPKQRKRKAKMLKKCFVKHILSAFSCTLTFHRNTIISTANNLTSIKCFFNKIFCFIDSRFKLFKKKKKEEEEEEERKKERKTKQKPS
jgi:hypothetical protein